MTFHSFGNGWGWRGDGLLDNSVLKNKNLPTDPDLRGSISAIKRAATNALKLARKTHTPCYVVKDGTIVNAAEQPKAPARKKQIATK